MGGDACRGDAAAGQRGKGELEEGLGFKAAGKKRGGAPGKNGQARASGRRLPLAGGWLGWVSEGGGRPRCV